jgi:hypothetical protein
MLTSEPFYHSTTQKVLASFGAVFNDIYVASYRDGKKASTKRVPLTYAPGQKWLKRIRDREDLESKKIAIKLPRMSYEIAGIAEDSVRRLPRKNMWRYGSDTNATTQETQYMEVPYNMDVTMSIMSRSQDEGFQIVEQIVPYFAPDFTLSVKGLTGPSDKRSNLNITLTSVDAAIEYEGTNEDRDIFTWTLSFTIKFNYAGRVVDSSVIQSAQVDLTSDRGGTRVTASVVATNDTPTQFVKEVDIEQIDLGLPE